MTSQPKIESTEYSDLNKVAGWFIILRWIACLGVLAALLTADRLFFEKRPLTTLYVLNGFLGLINLAFMVYFFRVKDQNLSRREMSVFLHTQVSCDYVLLFLFVYLTGLFENPFVFFFVFHIMLTSFMFKNRIVYGYSAALIAVFCLAGIGQAGRFLPYYPMGALGNSDTYFGLIYVRLAGVCSTLVIVAYLVTSIKNRIEEHGKSVEIELHRYRSLDKLKSNFILQVTHELRGPVAALKGYHEMIMKGITGPIVPKTEEALHRANVRTQNLLNIIDEMIDYAYVTSAEDVKFKRAPVNLRAAIAANIDMYSPQADEKKLHLSYSCPADIELMVNADLLNIILSNLLTNAIKYSPSGASVSLTATQEGNSAHIQLSDTGIGIDAAEISAIFDEFFRSRKAKEMERDGTGLGLSIVQKVVEFLDGKITVYSEEGKGSNFHVTLPLQGGRKEIE